MNTFKRIESIDILRGLVMILMVLDHTRDYFHINAFAGNYPENLESTTGILFFTRFITHFCAPIFVLLAGISAFLYGENKTKKQLSFFLVTRGFWLIFIEITLLNFLWWFDFYFEFINLQVIWAIGVCMLILGVLIHLPKKIILGISLLILIGHNSLDGLTVSDNQPLAWLWHLLHQSGGGFTLGQTYVAFSYPVLPWIGIISLGYVIGNLFSKNRNSDFRKKILIKIGIASICLFFLLRGFNIYADINPWEFQESTIKTIISFFNVSKYPPSLAYTLITLGPAFIFLAWIERFKNKITDLFLVFGRVPFFFYVIHVGTIHLLAILGLLITGNDWHKMILNNNAFTNPEALTGYGYPLYMVYIIWLIILILLYPLCKSYMNYKAKNKDKWWLSYI
jgi:uncharacterized membrane protein